MCVGGGVLINLTFSFVFSPLGVLFAFLEIKDGRLISGAFLLQQRSFITDRSLTSRGYGQVIILVFRFCVCIVITSRRYFFLIAISESRGHFYIDMTPPTGH